MKQGLKVIATGNLAGVDYQVECENLLTTLKHVRSV